MFETIVEALHGELLNACPPDRNYSLADLKADVLPEPVSRYAQDALRAAAEEEVESLRPGGLRWIDVQDDTLNAYERFAATALANATVPPDEWETLLRACARKAIEHSVRPRTGLVDAVFEDTDSALGHEEVVGRISRFHGGLPLRAAVVRAIKKGTSRSFDRSGFRSLVDRVHDALTLDYTRSDWRRDLEPLQSLLAAAGMDDGLPLDAATALIEDVADRAAAESLRGDDRSPIDCDALLDLLSGPEEEDAPADSEPAGLGDGKSTAKEDPKSDSVPLWQRFQKNLNEPISSNARPHTSQHSKPKEDARSPQTAAAPAPRMRSEPISVDSADQEESQRPLWQKYSSTRANEADELPPTDIEMQILGKQAARTRESFVSVLFDGDEDSYIGVLNQLRKARSWSEASHVIAENVFKRFQVNIYCDEAVAFTNAVEARFRVNHAGD